MSNTKKLFVEFSKFPKCHFTTTEVEYLGFHLTPNGVLPTPDSVQKVRQFLGHCNFFRNHIRDFALKSHPLSVLTWKDIDWKGGTLPQEALTAFQELKTALTSSLVVSFPRCELQYALINDAATAESQTPGGMLAILTQVDKESWFHVNAYASCKLIKHEENYMPFLQEMHAAMWGMEHFSHHLKGQQFLLFTDHKPLEKLGKVHTSTLFCIQEAMMSNIINYLQTGIVPQSQLKNCYGARCFLDKMSCGFTTCVLKLAIDH